MTATKKKQTVTEIVSNKLEIKLLELKSQNTKALESRLQQLIGITVESLTEAAMIIRILEERGRDLSRFNLGYIAELREIAHGRMLTEVAVQFAGRTALRNAVARLPLEKQKELLDTRTVSVVREGPGGLRANSAPPEALTKKDINLVFDGARIRSTEEQKAILINGHGHHDGNGVARADDFITVILKPKQKAQIRILAAQEAVSMSELVVKALQEIGLIHD